MEEKQIRQKTICLVLEDNEEKSLQINFLDALSSLYENIANNIYYCITDDEIKEEVDYIDQLIAIAINCDGDYINLYKKDYLFIKILDGLKSKIEKEIS